MDSSAPSAAELFEALDVNNEGFLTREQLASAIADPSQVDSVMDMFDPEGTGKISQEQFIKCFDVFIEINVLDDGSNAAPVEAAPVAPAELSRTGTVATIRKMSEIQSLVEIVGETPDLDALENRHRSGTRTTVHRRNLTNGGTFGGTLNQPVQEPPQLQRTQTVDSKQSRKGFGTLNGKTQVLTYLTLKNGTQKFNIEPVTRNKASKLKKIMRWCEENQDDNGQISTGEMIITLGFLARQLSEEEQARVNKMMMMMNREAVDLRSLRTLLSECARTEKYRMENDPENCQFDVESFLEHFFQGFESSEMRAMLFKSIETENSEIEALHRHIQALSQRLQAYGSRLDKSKKQLKAQEVENIVLRRERDDAKNASLATKRRLDELMDSLHMNRNGMDQLYKKINDLEKKLRHEMEEHQSARAMLEIERKRKDRLERDLKSFQDSIEESSNARAQLRAKLNTTSAIMEQRRNFKDLQDKVKRVADLEDVNKQLTEQVSRLEEQLRYFERLFDGNVPNSTVNLENLKRRGGSDGSALSDQMAEDGEERLANAEKTISMLQANLKAELERVHSLEEKNRQLIDNFSKQIELLTTEKEAALDARFAAENKCKQLEETRDTLSAQVKDLSSTLARQTAALKESEEALAHERAKNKDVDDMINQVVMRKTTELQLLAAEKDSMIKRSEEKVASLEEKLAELQRVLAEERTRSGNFDEALQLETQKRKQLEGNLDETNHQLQRQLQTVQSLREELSAAERKNEELTENFNQLNAKANRYESEVVNLQHKLSEQLEQCKLLQNQVQSLHEQMLQKSMQLDAEKSLESRLQELSAALMALQTSSAEKEASLKGESERRAALEIKLAEVQDILAKTQMALAEKDSTLAVELKRSRGLEDQISDLTNQNSRLSAQNRDISSMLELEKMKSKALDEKVKELLAIIERLTAQLEEKSASLKSEQDKALSLAQCVNELRGELAKATALYLASQEARDALEREKADLLASTPPPQMEPMEPTESVEEKSEYRYIEINLPPQRQLELTVYARLINAHLDDDEDVEHLMPIEEKTPDLLLKLRDGLMLAKFINLCAPGTIDERALNKLSVSVLPDGQQGYKPLTWNELMQNINLCLSAAKSLGVTMRTGQHHRDDQIGTRVGPSGGGLELASSQLQLMECSEPELIIDFLFELFKVRYLQPVSVISNPRLAVLGVRPHPADVAPRVLFPEKPVHELKAMGPEELLMRWINYQLILAKTPEKSTVTNFTTDLRDLVAFAHIVDRIAEEKDMDLKESKHQLAKEAKGQDTTQFAKRLLEVAEQLGVPPYMDNVQLSANSERMNLLFAAFMIQCEDGIKKDAPPSQSDSTAAKLGEVVRRMSSSSADGPRATSGSVSSDMHDVTGDLREEKAFRMWINSAGVPGVYVNNLATGCRDGLVLLRMLEYIEPRSVNWKKVEMYPNNKFKAVANCNYVIAVAKKELHLSLVGIGGSDIYDGNEKLILALVWQMMRYHTIKQLQTKNMQRSQDGGDDNVEHDAAVNDETIIKWANVTVSSRLHGQNPVPTIKSFRDPNLATGTFLMNLVHGMNDKIVNWDLVMGGGTASERMLNAGYVISLARKLGAEVFLSAKDIVDVRDKMVLLFVGSLMAVSSHNSY